MDEGFIYRESDFDFSPIIRAIQPGNRYHDGALTVMNEYIHRTIYCILRVAHLATIHGRRVSLLKKDLELALKSINSRCNGHRCQDLCYDPEHVKVPKRALSAMAFKVGYHRKYQNFYDEFPHVIASIIKHLLGHIDSTDITVAKVNQAIIEIN